MKNIIFAFLTLASLSSMASSSSSGFKITRNDSIEIRLKHHSGLKLILSKTSFENEKKAIAFCKARNASIDTEFNALLLAMSGLASENKAIEKLISFTIPDSPTSGIVSWTGEGKDVVRMMYNGRGTATDEIPVDQINLQVSKHTKNSNFKFKVPALCVI